MTNPSTDADKAHHAPADTPKKSRLTAERQRIEEMLDEASRDSFPASDPPSWISRGLEDTAAPEPEKKSS